MERASGYACFTQSVTSCAKNSRAPSSVQRSRRTRRSITHNLGSGYVRLRACVQEGGARRSRSDSGRRPSMGTVWFGIPARAPRAAAPLPSPLPASRGEGERRVRLDELPLRRSARESEGRDPCASARDPGLFTGGVYGTRTLRGAQCFFHGRSSTPSPQRDVIKAESAGLGKGSTEVAYEARTTVSAFTMGEEAPRGSEERPRRPRGAGALRCAEFPPRVIPGGRSSPAAGLEPTQAYARLQPAECDRRPSCSAGRAGHQGQFRSVSRR
jgi:hypothetical protein